MLAAETLARPTVAPAAVIGCGVNGRAVGRTFLARGREVLLWDAQPEQAGLVAEGLGEGAGVAADVAEALAADIVVTVTPGREPLLRDGELHAGQHVSLMGADGPGKAEITVDELLRARVVCDEWGQASHNGDISYAFEAGAARAGGRRRARASAPRRGGRPSRRARDHRLRLDRARSADLAIAGGLRALAGRAGRAGLCRRGQCRPDVAQTRPEGHDRGQPRATSLSALRIRHPACLLACAVESGGYEAVSAR